MSARGNPPRALTGIQPGTRQRKKAGIMFVLSVRILKGRVYLDMCIPEDKFAASLMLNGRYA